MLHQLKKSVIIIIYLMKKEVPGLRYRLLDMIRTLALVNMVAYHAMWNWANLVGGAPGWYSSAAGYIWQQCICWTFILLSGFCLPLGSHGLRRGLTVFAAGALVTAVTTVVMPEQRIVFGVLTLLGSCMLIMYPLKKPLAKLPPAAGLLVSAALFFLTRNIGRGSLGFEDFNILALPDWLYKNYLTAYIGFPPPWFSSTDYFPVFPWIFLFMAGYFLFLIFQKRDWLRFLNRGGSDVLTWPGRHSLVIYLLHQPALFLIMTLLEAL